MIMYSTGESSVAQFNTINIALLSFSLYYDRQRNRVDEYHSNALVNMTSPMMKNVLGSSQIT